MTPNFRTTGGQEYLDANIQTASPARLRLMLIERGVEVARQLSDAWRGPSPLENHDSSGQASAAANEYSLKLFEILNELLSGVTGDKDEICRKVADLYVFLTKHLITAEEVRDADAIDEIRLVLETEAETWRMVCVNEAPVARNDVVQAGGQSHSGGLNLEA